MSEPAPPPPSPAAGVHFALLECENCGRETEHRILRLDPRVGGGTKGVLRGVARCRVCRWTHDFQTVPAASIEVPAVLSEGRKSRSEPRPFPVGTRLEIGELVPGSSEPPLRVLRIDLPGGLRVRSADVSQIGTVWLTPYRGEIVRISMIEGRHTRSVTVTYPATESFSVGGEVRVEGRTMRIVGLRARGQTWKVPGDTFHASEVDRIYARRNAIPPAGRSAWSRERGRPSSRESSTSRPARSRSGPGVRTNRA
jgi:uncharacterized Zn finger protein